MGFALAKGLIRGLTRCPNPSSYWILVYYPFLDVCEGVRAVPTVSTLNALDPVQMGVDGGVSLRMWECSLLRHL